MPQLNNKMPEKPTPSGKLAKPKKPLPTEKEPAKILAPCSLSEERIREIAREEAIKYANELSIRRIATYNLD